jgi:hypothetical protein
MKSHFRETNWLWQGNPSQVAAIEALDSLGIFENLKEFNPVFAGTIPIGVDLGGSDIDILCEVTDFSRFQVRLRECYETQKNFFLTEKFVNNQRSIMCRFEFEKFRIEVFAQKTPIEQQDAFVHMVAEARLLEIGGDEARNEIKKLKLSGYKTEPAFAKYFDIDGDAYDEILKIASISDNDFKKRFNP